eukprot:425643-Amphidinium_carterae.1
MGFCCTIASLCPFWRVSFFVILLLLKLIAIGFVGAKFGMIAFRTQSAHSKCGLPSQTPRFWESHWLGDCLADPPLDSYGKGWRQQCMAAQRWRTVQTAQTDQMGSAKSLEICTST